MQRLASVSVAASLCLTVLAIVGPMEAVQPLIKLGVFLVVGLASGIVGGAVAQATSRGNR